MQRFLRSTSIIDYQDADVRALAAELVSDSEPQTVASRCFEWVRDNIRHSLDHNDDRVTISASEVLRHGTGLCYAKSHLLAALLRANGIPCGLVYQRLAVDETGNSFCLHGLNAVWLPDHAWYRIDPRGNREGITTSFDPPRECLAFATSLLGEGLINEIFADPLSVVVDALTRCATMAELCTALPDWKAESSVKDLGKNNLGVY
ncbi:MAG: transglutaminase family protein, partial [Planctomycetales bacterium]|nr:transglutaminase family protein [Planctomycetales bacterium]